MKTKLQGTIEVEATPAVIAAVFCEMDDEQQAQFFIEVARIAGGWPRDDGMQWWRVGKHLRECGCSSDTARDIVRDIANGVGE